MELRFTVPCLFGLEGLAADELKRLNMREVRAENGHVCFNGDKGDIARANINLRTGERVLIDVGDAPAKTFDELFEAVRAMPWDRYIPMDGAFPVKGHSLNSALHSIPDCQRIVKKAIVDIVEDLYRYEVQPIQGMPDYIHQCHQQGIQLVVVTSNRQDLTEMVLERFGVLSCFDKLYCSSNNGLVKRDPNTYVHILNELGVRAEDTLLFEDAYYAIASAAQSGIPAIGIASPMNQKDFIEHQVRTIQDYTELL